jgi:hypothetical protein
MVLNRAIMTRIDRGFDGPASDGTDRLLSSILSGLAIVGGLGTVLGAAHLFRLEVIVPLVLVLLVWLRAHCREVMKDLKGLLVRGFFSFRAGNPTPLLIILILAVLLYVATIAGLIPSPVADVWVFHVPLTKSIIEHHGFVSPQIDHPFYGNIPLFFHVLFACAMLFTDHWFAANVVNICIFIGFLALLTSCGKHWRGAGFLLVVWLIVAQDFFSGSVAQPMTDLPRSCFAIASVLFLWRYLESRRPSELLQCALVLGGAVGSKYTELQMLGLVGLVLLPLILRGRISLGLFAVSLAGFAIVAAYWYLKNLIVLGNPVYPFIFGHPGLSDAWMADYTLELGRAFDPENRHFVTNLATRQGWRDFLWILYDWFLASNPNAMTALVLIIAGLVLSFRRLAMPVAFTAIMFVVWYTVMFNHIRWAMPAYLLFFCSAYIGAVAIREGFAGWIDHKAAPAYAEVSRILVLPRHLSTIVLVLFIAVAAAGAGRVIWLQSQGRWQLTHGTRADMFIGRLPFDRYLETQLEGYKIYRYIAAHDLKPVFQPFDTAGSMYAAAFNGGVDGQWLFPRTDLPKPGEDIGQFLAQAGIRYFISIPIPRPEFLAERIGAANLAMATKTIDYMMPHATLLTSDDAGWKLYRYDQAAP